MINLEETYRNLELDVFSDILNTNHSYTIRINKKSEIAHDEEIQNIVGVLRNLKDDTKIDKELIVIGDWKLKSTEIRRLKYFTGVTFLLGINDAALFGKSNCSKMIVEAFSIESKCKYTISAYANGRFCIRFERGTRTEDAKDN